MAPAQQTNSLIRSQGRHATQHQRRQNGCNSCLKTFQLFKSFLLCASLHFKEPWLSIEMLRHPPWRLLWHQVWADAATAATPQPLVHHIDAPSQGAPTALEVGKSALRQQLDQMHPLAKATATPQPRPQRGMRLPKTPAAWQTMKAR